MLVHRRVTPSIKFGGTHLYTWVEGGTVRVKCFTQEHNTMSSGRARTWTVQSRDEHANHWATAPPTGYTKIIQNYMKYTFWPFPFSNPFVFFFLFGAHLFCALILVWCEDMFWSKVENRKKRNTGNWSPTVFAILSLFYPTKISPRLKSRRSVNGSSLSTLKVWAGLFKCKLTLTPNFFFTYVLCGLRLHEFKKWRTNNANRKPSQNVTKLK